MDNPKLQPPATLGSMIDQMFAIRQQRAELSTEDKKLSAEYEALGAQVMALLDEQGTTMSRAATASAVITEEEVAQVEDWDAVYNYIVENEAFFLLQRRFNNAPWRELRANGDEVPGTAPVKVRKVAVRKI